MAYNFRGIAKGNDRGNFVSSVDEVTSVAQDTIRIPVKHAVIDVTSSGNNVVVAAVPGKRILVMAYNYVSNGAVNVHWRSASTPISGPMYMDAASKGKVCPYNPKGWCRTAVGEALNLNLSAAVAVGGEITYAEIEDPVS